MEKKEIVQFVKPWRGYAPKEKAGFDAETAKALEKAGIAFPPGKAPKASAEQS
ncbi:hypothetical protein [Pseudomonas sp. TUM22785]|uniref:hypothetical protein n=1 Tax=Pseudomonas sp. TUM22785 TaxID=3019098 RepID=UPI00230658F2|nr:hypothetical protein [Pseudomonas sp. TUM22785]WCD82990.1 hypothetical protein PI990_13480 [Pseudomonas sp. TUM22785]